MELSDEGELLMVQRNWKEKYLRTAILYGIATVLSLLILTLVMRLWHANLSIPFNYSGDGLFTEAEIKGIVDNGWFVHNQFLGAPFGLNMYDYPNSDGLILLFIKVISYITSNVPLIINLTYILTYVLTTILALYVFRQFGISVTVSMVLGLLYSFLPYHFWRSEGHFFLSFYFQVPLLMMVTFWVMKREFVFGVGALSNLKNLLRQRKFLISILICLISSSMGVYYAFFACFFLLVAGVITMVKDRSVNQMIVSLVLVSVLGIGVVVNLAPDLLYVHYNGVNTEVALRSPADAELYGLKITQLLLPVTDHRIKALSDLKARYNAVAPLVNENDSTTLGIVGSIGFLILIAVGIFGRKNDQSWEILKQLATLNLSGILLATIGGFSSLFALIISPEIRAYNRIVVFIAFMSLFAVGLIIDKLLQFINATDKRRWVKYLAYILPMLVLVVGIYDQTNLVHGIPDYGGIKSEYNSDGKFVKLIEGSLPQGSMVFQLPYIPFPEYPPVNKIVPYDLMRGYLHSSNLHWSYATMKGRAGDAWYKEVSEQPVSELLKTISLSGFNGIYIDRYGYIDQANSLIKDISNRLGEQPTYSENQRLAFFSLLKFNSLLKMDYTPRGYGLAKEEALSPLSILWKGGFYDLETSSQGTWHWCSSTGELELDNFSDKSKIVKLQMSLASGYPDKSHLTINGSNFSDTVTISSELTPYEKTISIPPGKYLIKFSSDAKRIDAPQDPRYLVFRVEDFMSTIVYQSH